MALVNDFLGEVEAFLKRHDMLPTTFGKKVMGDPSFVFRLRNGRNSSAATIDKVRRYMRRREKAAA